MSVRLSRKVCVITGTGGSVGRAAAVAFAREGASVVGCGRNVAEAQATVEMVRLRKRRRPRPNDQQQCAVPSDAHHRKLNADLLAALHLADPQTQRPAAKDAFEESVPQLQDRITAA